MLPKSGKDVTIQTEVPTSADGKSRLSSSVIFLKDAEGWDEEEKKTFYPKG